MSWRDRLLPASFAGKGFKVLSSGVTGGRRITQKERPGNLLPFKERTVTIDSGPVLPTFSLEGYIVQNPLNGNDYFSERDALITALSTYRPNGEFLIHPFYGALKVHAGEHSVEETFNEGGIARFRMTFYLEEAQLFPAQTNDFNTAIATQALQTIGQASDGFFNAFNRAASFVDSLGGAAVFAIQKMQQGVARVNGVIGSTVATALGVMSAAIALIDTVLDSPCDLFNTMKSAADGFRNIVGMAGEVVESGVVGGCSGEERSAGTTLDGETIPEQLGISTVDQLIASQDFDEDDLEKITEGQSDNRALLISIIKLLLLSLAAEIAVRIEYKNQENMFYVLNKLAAAIEALLIRLGDITNVDTNDMFISLENLRSLLFAALLEKGAELKRTVDYTVPNAVTTVLNVAYDLYEDIDREQEIYDRNVAIARHPGFLPSGDKIRVLEE